MKKHESVRSPEAHSDDEHAAPEEDRRKESSPRRTPQHQSESAKSLGSEIRNSSRLSRVAYDRQASDSEQEEELKDSESEDESSASSHPEQLRKRSKRGDDDDSSDLSGDEKSDDDSSYSDDSDRRNKEDGDHSQGSLTDNSADSSLPSISHRQGNRPLMQELRRLPSQRSWSQPVDVKRPKSILRRIRLYCGKIVEQPQVQIMIIILIVTNGIMLGIATFDAITDNPTANAAFSEVDRVFLIIFTIELALQLMYRFLAFFTDGWLIFDFVIVIASWSLEQLQIFRAFRVFRAVRLVTRIGPLRELVLAIAAVMPRMYAIAMLLLLIFYIYAVLFTELFGDLELSEAYFVSLDASLFTCLEMMTLEWASIAREVMVERSWAWAPFLSFISITGFIVFNLIVAVVCDAVKVVDQEIRAEEMASDEDDDSDRERLLESQERIWEIEKEVVSIRRSQVEMEDVVRFLIRELAALEQDSFNMVSTIAPDSEFFQEPGGDARAITGESDQEESTEYGDANQDDEDSQLVSETDGPGDPAEGPDSSSVSSEADRARGKRRPRAQPRAGQQRDSAPQGSSSRIENGNKMNGEVQGSGRLRPQGSRRKPEHHLKGTQRQSESSLRSDESDSQRGQPRSILRSPGEEEPRPKVRKPPQRNVSFDK